MKVGKSSLAAQFLTSDHVETFANQGRHIFCAEPRFHVPSMATKPIKNRWFRTDSQPY